MGDPRAIYRKLSGTQFFDVYGDPVVPLEPLDVQIEEQEVQETIQASEVPQTISGDKPKSTRKKTHL